MQMTTNVFLAIVGLTAACANSKDVAGLDGGQDGGPSGDSLDRAPLDVMNPTDAAPIKEPQRLILITHKFGFLDESFEIPPATEQVREAQWDSPLTLSSKLSAVLQPFEGLQNELTVLGGLAFHTAWAGRGWDEYLQTMLLTGMPPGVEQPGKISALGPSLDWLIATQNQPPNGLPLLIFRHHLRNSFDGSGKALDGLPFPAAYDALFQVANDCDHSARPSEWSGQGSAPLTDWMDRVVPLATDALRCDRTRVINIELPTPSGNEMGLGASLIGDLDQDFNDTVDQRLESRRVMRLYETALAKAVARVTLSIKAVITTDGSSLLDHTMIIWMSGDGQPGNRSIPWNGVVLGGRSLGVLPGRYVHFAQDLNLIDGAGQSVRSGPSHHHLLVSIAHRFGLNLNAVGLRSLHVNGSALDLTGPLASF